MKNFKQKLLILALFICLAPLFGQSYSRGAILDPALYGQVDSKPVLLTRNYTSLPRSISLKQFSPIPENQGDYGTCVGWSSAFAARTISESAALNRTNQQQSTNSAFSAIYLYKNISRDPNAGASIYDAMEFMKKTGLARRLSNEKSLDYWAINVSMFANAQKYPISGYVKLFSTRIGVPGTIEERVLPVKKSLAEGKPVVFGMNCPDSFFDVKDVWRPRESATRNYGGHAMCVIGYNDDLHGGAFEIQNSWGTDWGTRGYAWIRYTEFAAFVDEAYEIIENLAAYKESVKFGASIEIEVFNDSWGMPVTYNREGFYRTRWSYPSGTDFRFLMTNRHPAYVYAFAADSTTTGVGRIFPSLGYSPVLDYTNSSVAWPGEHDWIRLDNNVGTDYLVVLYSKEALDIGAIERRYASERGAFPERVAKAVGANFVSYGNVQYNAGKVEFTAETTNEKAVIGLLLAIDHRAP